MRSTRKRPCAIVIVVFATITEGTLASSGTRPRRSQAFTASPPSAAVGVTRLKASPARRTSRRVRKATASRRNANCHPSVSNTMTSATGKQSTIASRHESWTIEARIAAGSFVATRTANRATPTTSRTSRRWRRSALPVEEQQDADRGERAGPEPSGHPRLGVGHALPEPQGPERPRAGVVADQQEAGEPQEDQRPVARPARSAGRVQDCEKPHREHEQPCDVVVELGPRAVRGGPRGVAIV